MYSKDSQSERNNQSDDATRISPERAAQARQSQQDHSSLPTWLRNNQYQKLRSLLKLFQASEIE